MHQNGFRVPGSGVRREAFDRVDVRTDRGWINGLLELRYCSLTLLLSGCFDVAWILCCLSLVTAVVGETKGD
jgi:hypothetical protein